MAFLLYTFLVSNPLTEEGTVRTRPERSRLAVMRCVVQKSRVCLVSIWSIWLGMWTFLVLVCGVVSTSAGLLLPGFGLNLVVLLALILRS